jgi:hypothetical protein
MATERIVDLSRLADALNDEGLDALEAYVRATVVPMILRSIPVGDPELDPDPSTSLRDNLKVRREGKQIVIEIDTEYAAVQHFAYYLHPRGGHNRFLEDPLQVAAGFVENVIGEAVRQRLARET